MQWQSLGSKRVSHVNAATGSKLFVNESAGCHFAENGNFATGKTELEQLTVFLYRKELLLWSLTGVNSEQLRRRMEE